MKTISEIHEVTTVKYGLQYHKRWARYIIPGNPMALARPRFGTKGRVYDAQKPQKLIHGITLQSQHNDEPFFTGPLHLIMKFFFPMARKRSHLENHWHTQRPDLSNCIKYYEDIATGICYHDDALIAKIDATKFFSAEPRTELTIMEM